MSNVGRHVRVNGRVQGVYFRGWTVEQARELGVVGWVSNCADGSVEAQLSGEEQAVMQLIERMRGGPEGAQVTQLTAEDVPPRASSGFEVRIS